MLLHWLWELKDIVLTLPMNDPFDLDTLNTLTVLSPLWIQLATHFTPSSRTSITSLYNLWGDINLSSEEILSGSFIVFAEDISNVKAFFLEVEHEGISGLKTPNFTYSNPNSTHTYRSFDKFTITGLVDFPSDTEHSTSTFRSVWSFPTVFSE